MLPMKAKFFCLKTSLFLEISDLNSKKYGLGLVSLSTSTSSPAKQDTPPCPQPRPTSGIRVKHPRTLAVQTSSAIIRMAEPADILFFQSEITIIETRTIDNKILLLIWLTTSRGSLQEAVSPPAGGNHFPVHSSLSMAAPT